MDTLKMARRLQGQFNREQAEAIAEAVSETQGDLVTKDFLRAELAAMKHELIFWVAGLLIIAVLVQKFL